MQTRLTRGQRNIAWIESHCIVPEGRLVGQRVKLDEFQRNELLRIYDNPHGTRTAILSFGRKNGKTTLAACIVLLHLVGPEARRNSSIYSAARSQDQAAVLFNLARQMVEMSEALSNYVEVKDHKKELFCPALGVRYKALSADAKTKYGLSPSLIVHDELGQVEASDDALYNALETAVAAQTEPLTIIISTQASSDTALLSTLIDDAATGADPHTVLALYTCPTVQQRKEQGLEPLDIFSDEALRLANPGFDTIQNKDAVRKMASDASRMPSRLPSFRNLVLNQRVDLVAPFIDLDVWRGLEESGTDETCDYMGLDLSSTNDLTALVWMKEHKRVADDGKVTTVVKFGCKCWLPARDELTLQAKSRQDKVPYVQWRDKGYLTVHAGDSLDYDLMMPEIVATIDAKKPKIIGFDRWNFPNFEKALQRYCKSVNRNAGVLMKKFIKVGMGSATMSPAIREFETAVLSGALLHDGNPLLTMCVSNARTKGPDNARVIVKKNSRSRIDVAVGSLICLAVRANAPKLDNGNLLGVM